MLLDLNKLRGTAEHLDRQYEPAAFDLKDPEFRIIAPVALKAEASKHQRKVRLVGRVQTTLEVDCGRCLEPLTVPVNAAFEATYLPAAENTGQVDQEVSADDLTVSYYQDDVIDLGQLIREQLYLALPMKPLCRDDCQGLCPECGANHNRETCDCRHEWVDPRLAVLKALLEKKH
jgi:uncharacterized protein